MMLLDWVVLAGCLLAVAAIFRYGRSEVDDLGAGLAQHLHKQRQERKAVRVMHDGAGR